MVLLLGATTYVGQAFARALRRRKDPFIPLSRSALDYTQFEFLFDYVRKIHPDLLINAEEQTGATDGHNGGGLSGQAVEPSFNISPQIQGDHRLEGKGRLQAGEGPNFSANSHSGPPPAQFPGMPHPHHPVSAEEADRIEMLQANTLLPQTIARVCEATRTAWGHVSSGSIYCGAKYVDNGNSRIADVTTSTTRSLFNAHPERFRGFAESDAPNFCFKAAPCTFYSGTKALAEEALDHGDNYIWRLRLPFNEQDDPCNFLSQLQDCASATDAINSLSHLDDCVGACLELWDRRAPFGIYNVVNPGAVRTHDVVVQIQRILKPSRQLRLMVYDQDEAADGEKAARSDCILDVSKLLKTGVKLRSAEQAIGKALHDWHPHTARAIRTLA